MERVSIADFVDESDSVAVLFFTAKIAKGAESWQHDGTQLGAPSPSSAGPAGGHWEKLSVQLAVFSFQCQLDETSSNHE